MIKPNNGTDAKHQSFQKQHTMNHYQLLTCYPSYSAPQCTHCKRCTSYCNSVRLSVRLSVTRRYCVRTSARSTVQFALSQNVSSFVETKKIFPRDDPFPLESWFKPEM